MSNRDNRVTLDYSNFKFVDKDKLKPTLDLKNNIFDNIKDVIQWEDENA